MRRLHQLRVSAPRHNALRLSALCITMWLAGCLGGRQRRPNATVAARADSAPTARKRDTTKAPVNEPARNARDSAAIIARADSAAKLPVNTAPTSKKDSSTTKVAKKAEPATKPCVLDFNESPPETRMRSLQLPDSSRLTFIGGGFVGHCQGEKNRISADSMEHYQASGILNLFGTVTYDEPGKLHMDSQRATYFLREGRVIADGNVVATQLASGSRFLGPSMEYLRPMPNTRPISRLNAPGRPTLEIIEKDSTGKPGAPISIVATTMVDVGDSVVFAWGDVRITRTTLQGESDSASFDKLSERSRLIRTARITNRDKDQPFRMAGDTIDIFSKDKKLDRVVALHNGNASNNDVVMQAEILDMRFKDQKLDRAFASGKGRAKATTATQELNADSLAIRLPDQKVRQVTAVGKAIAWSKSDTSKLRSDERDFLAGDTVISWFDSTAVKGDTSGNAHIREIHAGGNASSFQQIASKEGPKARPSISYSRGKFMQVVFDSGQVRYIAIDSQASGVYQEPVPDSLSDSTKKAKAAAGAKVAKPPIPAVPARKGGESSDSIVLPSVPRRRP